MAHAGRFASLANAWVNAHRVELEETEWAEIKKRVAAVEEQLAKK